MCSLQTLFDSERGIHTQSYIKQKTNKIPKKKDYQAHELTRLRIIEVHHCTITNGTTVTFQIKLKHGTLMLFLK